MHDILFTRQAKACTPNMRTLLAAQGDVEPVDAALNVEFGGGVGVEFEFFAAFDGKGEFGGEFAGFEGGGFPEEFAVEEDGGAGFTVGGGGIVEADAEGEGVEGAVE